MLRLDRTNGRFLPLRASTLPAEGVLERDGLQRMIRSTPELFFEELGEELLILGEEVRPSEHVADRIDLLALDKDGAAVIIELKRGSHKLHLLQAITYAAMMAKWEPADIVRQRSAFTGQSEEESRDEIEQFLDADLTGVNRAQRLLLVAEDFEYQVLAAAEWLWEGYGADVRCYRMSLALDSGAEYLAATSIYPPAEIAQYAVAKGQGGGLPHGTAPGTWEEALEAVESPEVRAFFEEELANGTPGNAAHGKLRYVIAGRRRYTIHLRRDFAYALQFGRFEGDEAFWAERLGSDAELEPKRGGRRLRFRLRTQAQFAAFREALAHDVPSKVFLHNLDELEENGADLEP